MTNPEHTKKERWAPVLGFEGYYEVSDHGRVRSLDRTITRSDGKIKRFKGAVLSVTPNRGEHPRVGLWRHNKAHRRLIHRIVLEAFAGECPDGLEGCHGDGNPQNNHLENLRWDTSAANSADMIKHGRSNIGERCPGSKLLEADIPLIRAARAAGDTIAAIAARMGVGVATVADVLHGRTWTHV
jgi:hypothetical protein